jgi:methylated-DNA-[protein]-cysteine S-methyltransferase
MTPGLAVFPTAIGPCAIAWSGKGICGFALPGRDTAATETALRRRFPALGRAEPPPVVADAITRAQALLEGGATRFDACPLDLDGVSDFNRAVYAVILGVPPGETITYGEIATRIGDPGAARAVGKALGENPIPLIVPCHRVLAAGGRAGGFSAPGGLSTKRKLLAIESRHAPGPPDLFSAMRG